jgi:hypothetical protein
MQGFWVRVDTTKTSGTLQANSLVRTTNGSTFYKKTSSDNPLLRLAVKLGPYEDETVLRFMEASTEHFDGEYDAYKMMNEGGQPSLYTQIGSTSYAINSLKQPESEIVIPLMLKVNKPGLYKLSLKEILSFDPSYSIILEDKALDITHDLNKKPEYERSIDNSDSIISFSIRIKRSVATSVSDVTEEQDVKITLRDRILHINSNLGNDASLSIYSTKGTEMVDSGSLSFNSGELTYDMSQFHSGMYIVKVLINNKSYSKKVFLH